MTYNKLMEDCIINVPAFSIGPLDDFANALLFPHLQKEVPDDIPSWRSSVKIFLHLHLESAILKERPSHLPSSYQVEYAKRGKQSMRLQKH